MTKRPTIDESRRLTGPNLLTDYPGAVLELFIEGFDHKQVIKLWEQAASELLDALNLPVELHSRDFEDGVSLYLRADEDKLYAACEINEAAVEQVERLRGDVGLLPVTRHERRLGEVEDRQRVGNPVAQDGQVDRANGGVQVEAAGTIEHTRRALEERDR